MSGNLLSILITEPFVETVFGRRNYPPKYYLISKIYRYDGEFNTKLRVRFVTENQIFISNEFAGKVNPSQFEVPEFLPLFTDDINRHYLKK
ncbi:hypothetical protein GCM10011339_28920 [Echinicola rosea]|uniref:Uncharacterized protein n=1 Tax=Echinicola rosea TaxID=1807691 RepID=A0ABQ1V5C0_9BACT|nr:hypothetical protein GCM10011339_28920 [Echinicola rosea]